MNLARKTVVFFLFCCGLAEAYAVAKLTTVVLDAGHGGTDAGAVGKHALEKDINLAVVLSLGKMIETNFSDVKVYYTRKTDEFIDVWRRPKVANQYKADLFISVHCNSSELKRNMPYPKGFETYVMGLHKSAENLAVAQKENASILLEKGYEETYDGFNPQSPEAYIIFSLFQNAYLDQSLGFASRLQEQYRGRIPSVDRGVKQAGFLVLHGATMPSVLTEIGFINNPDEENFIASAEGRSKIVEALFLAFKEYKYAVDGFNNQTENTSPELFPDTAVSFQSSSGRTASAVVDPAKDSQKPDSMAIIGTTKTFPRIVYKVQFASSSLEKSLNAPEFKHIEDPGKYKHQGAYKYTSGEVKSMEEATALLRKVQNQGYRDAFIVVFKDDERITPTEALKILRDPK